MVGSFRVVIYDYHVEEVTVFVLHLPRLFYYVLQFFLLKTRQFIFMRARQPTTLTLYVSPFLIFFWRSFSRLGGATNTTYGFKSDVRSIFKL
jgi:hypothetical protein